MKCVNILTSTNPSLTDPYWCLEVYWCQTVSGSAMQVAAVFDELLLPLATVGFSYPGHQRLLCPKSLMLTVTQCSRSYIKDYRRCLCKGFGEIVVLFKLAHSLNLLASVCLEISLLQVLFGPLFPLLSLSKRMLFSKHWNHVNRVICLTVWLHLSDFS